MKKFAPALLLALLVGIAVGVSFQPVQRVHAANPAPGAQDVFAVFSGTADSNAAPTQVIAGVSGQRIRIKDVAGGAVTAGPIGFYDGATFTTNVAVLQSIANGFAELTNQFFVGGPSALTGKVLTAGNGLYVAAPNGGAVYLTIRYEQD